MNINNNDVKQSLRKLDFPACVKDALPQIEAMVLNKNKSNLVMQLISEFVFLERVKEGDLHRGLPPHSLSKLQEFQLILVLIKYFSQPGPDSTRNAVFLSLFGANLTPQRSRVLCKLISTSVSGSVAAVLSSAGTWMQQVGCTTPPSLDVAQSLISDFIIFSRKTSEQLKQLPMVAPLFAANLMTAVADLYLNEQRGTLIAPPESLLDVFGNWISEDSNLCLASQQPLALPTGAIAMPVVTPLAGLIRWVVLAPLVSNGKAYSNLHVALLNTLVDTVNTGQTNALNAQHLVTIVNALKIQAGKRGLLENDKTVEKDENFSYCLERFAHAIQVALSSKCVYGNIPQLLCTLETLPPHGFMHTVIERHKPN